MLAMVQKGRLGLIKPSRYFDIFIRTFTFFLIFSPNPKSFLGVIYVQRDNRDIVILQTFCKVAIKHTYAHTYMLNGETKVKKET